MSLRLLYLIFIRLVGWLVLLARSRASKDARSVGAENGCQRVHHLRPGEHVAERGEPGTDRVPRTSSRPYPRRRCRDIGTSETCAGVVARFDLSSAPEATAHRLGSNRGGAAA